MRTFFTLALLTLNLHKAYSQTSKDIYQQTCKKIQNIYKQESIEKNYFISVDCRWEAKEIAFGFYSQENKVVRFGVSGDYARRVGMTSDALVLIFCHELGHALGGKPQAAPGNSFEGQADYYSTLKCFRKIVGQENNVFYVKNIPNGVTPNIIKDCYNTYSSQNEVGLCLRTMKASIDSIRSQPTATEVSFSLKADYVTKIYGPYEHPASQCRLDTLVAGTLNAPRPDCWYNPDALFWAF